MNNLILFPNGTIISVSDSTNLESLSGITYWDLSDQTWEGDGFFPVDHPKLSELELIQSILDNQARINYYLSEIEMFSPRKK